jgi:hypothetical protein
VAPTYFTPLPAALICPPRSLRQPSPLLFHPSPRIPPSPCAHSFSGAISRRSNVSSTRFSVARGLQERSFKRHYATSKLSVQGFRISFGKKSKGFHLPPLWHRMIVGYPKVRSASTTTPTLIVQLSLPNHHLPTVYSLPYASIRLRTMLILRSQWNRASTLKNRWHTGRRQIILPYPLYPLSRPPFFVPVALFLHHSSWRRNSCKTVAIRTGHGPNSLVFRRVRLVDASARSEKPLSGGFGSGNCLQRNPPLDVLSPSVRVKVTSVSLETIPWHAWLAIWTHLHLLVRRSLHSGGLRLYRPGAYIWMARASMGPTIPVQQLTAPARRPQDSAIRQLRRSRRLVIVQYK